MKWRCSKCPFWKKGTDQDFCYIGKCISYTGKCILLQVIKERLYYKLFKIKRSLVIKFDNLRTMIFKPKAPHHAYIGAFIMFLGYTMTGLELYKGWDTVFVTAGLLILVDDIIEHTIHRHTPLRIFFEKVMVPFLKRGNNE